MKSSRLITVVGARPQFVKAAVVSRSITAFSDRLSERIVHTGQHFDPSMSDVFFDQMAIPRPWCNLGIASRSHGAMTGAMLVDLEKILLQERPAAVLVYGDTNSTLAGALAASKLHIPVVHVEAGLRSFNKRMPEEQNRILTDHLSTLLLCPTNQAVLNLSREGLTDGVQWVGDVMYDAALFYADRASAPTTIAPSEPFYLVTVHRAENTDNPVRLRSIVDALNSVPQRIAVFPMHPRTRHAMANLGLTLRGHIRVIEPVGYFEMIWLERNAEFILTDSGGVQKEAYFFGRPCGTLRDETEWVETVDAGANTLLGADREKIQRFVREPGTAPPRHALYGAGDAGQKVVEEILRLGS